MSNSPLGLFAYPWDIIDEGEDAVIDAVKRAGLNTLFVTVNYHSGMFFLPHNPNRKIYFPEPGALYFEPSAWHKNHYFSSPVSKLTSNWNSFWSSLANKCQSNNITLGAWMLGLHNSGIGNQHKDLATYNAWNDPITHTLCPFNETVCDYLNNVARDVTKLGVFNKVLIESIEYLPVRHGHHHEVIGVDFPSDIDFLLSLNFSKQCFKHLNDKGIDGKSIANWVKSVCNDFFISAQNHKEMKWNDLEKCIDGEFNEYLKVRENSITKLTKSVISEFRQDKSIMVGLIDFGPLYPLGPNGRKWQNGVNLDSVLSIVDEIHPTYYFADLEINKSKHSIYTSIIDNQKPIIPAVRSILPQTPDAKSLLDQLNMLALESSGYNFYNYSFMNFETLDWIKEAVNSFPASKVL